MWYIRSFFKIKTEEIPIFFASIEKKKPFKRAREGAYCQITYDAHCPIKLSKLRLKSGQLIANQIWEFFYSYDYNNNNNNNNNNKERAIRTAYCDNKSTYEEILRRAKLPTLYTRWLQAWARLHKTSVTVTGLRACTRNLSELH